MEGTHFQVKFSRAANTDVLFVLIRGVEVVFFMCVNIACVCVCVENADDVISCGPPEPLYDSV